MNGGAFRAFGDQNCPLYSMKDYKKMSCVGCGEPFDEKSDVVVCPECGAPHHRECWKELGHCACEDKHGEGYEWQPEKIYIGDVRISPGIGQDSSDQSQDGRVICPQCGRSTKKSEKYCEYCGYYIYEDDAPFFEEKTSGNLNELFPFDPAEQLDGVPAGDMKRFVGNMWIYYIPRFVRMSRSKMPLSFNFTAFFMHGFWFVSRRMYLPGILLIMSVTGTSLIQAYFASIINGLSGNRLALVSMISALLSALEFIMMIFSGLFGNRIYMWFCARKVKNINARATARHADADEFNRELEEKGGVTLLPAVSMTVCYLAILYILEKGFLF